MEALFWSLLNRPYVTLFMAFFLLLSYLEQGWRRTVFWVLSSYSIALAAEWGSIHYHIPFGPYVYHYEVLTHDLVLLGVPFFDTLSFSFLSYVSFSFAQFFMSPLWVRGCDIRCVTSPAIRNSRSVLLLSAVLMVVIDLIVDPIARLGRYWFLGDIYHYPEPGIHFGVTFANYCGWFCVAITTVYVNQLIDRIYYAKKLETHEKLRSISFPYLGWFAPLFWAGIVFFQLGVTYWVAWNGPPECDTEMVQLQAVTGTYTVLPILILAILQMLKPSNRVVGHHPERPNLVPEKTESHIV